MFGSNYFGQGTFASSPKQSSSSSISGSALGSSTGSISMLQTFVVAGALAASSVASLAVTQTFLPTGSLSASSSATLAVTRVQPATGTLAADSSSSLSVLQTFKVTGTLQGDSSATLAASIPGTVTFTALGAGDSSATLAMTDYSGAYGIRVSNAGYDVLTDSNDNMQFTTVRPPLKIAYATTVTISMAANATESFTQVFTPVITTTTQYPIVFGDFGNGVMMRGNTGLTAESDYFLLAPYMTYNSLGGGQFSGIVNIDLQRNSSSSTWPGSVDIPVRIYVVAI